MAPDSGKTEALATAGLQRGRQFSLSGLCVASRQNTDACTFSMLKIVKEDMLHTPQHHVQEIVGPKPMTQSGMKVEAL